MDSIDLVLRQFFIVVAVICFPVLGAATLCGVSIAVLQAATQVQEQTLTLLPKMLVVGLMVALLGPFAMGLCASLFFDAMRAVPAITVGS